jgi:hypothetical protein
MLSPGGDGVLHDLIHLSPAAAREREEPLGVLRRVAGLTPGERPEERLGEQHHERLVADDHARGLLVRELRIEFEAERREEVHRLLQIADGEVDEDLSRMLFCHVSPSSCFN